MAPESFLSLWVIRLRASWSFSRFHADLIPPDMSSIVLSSISSLPSILPWRSILIALNYLAVISKRSRYESFNDAGDLPAETESATRVLLIFPQNLPISLQNWCSANRPPKIDMFDNTADAVKLVVSDSPRCS